MTDKPSSVEAAVTKLCEASDEMHLDSLTPAEKWKRWVIAKDNLIAAVRAEQPQQQPVETIQIRFDGPPGPEAGRFVEVEDIDGHGIRIGEWVQDGDYWLLVIPGRVTQQPVGHVANCECCYDASNCRQGCPDADHPIHDPRCKPGLLMLAEARLEAIEKCIPPSEPEDSMVTYTRLFRVRMEARAEVERLKRCG